MTRTAAFTSLALVLAAQPGDDCLPGSSGTSATETSATSSAVSSSAASSSAATSSASSSAATSSAASSSASTDATPSRPAGDFTVATFNVGLARGWVKEADARRPLIHDALSRERLDLVCVQEYWSTEDYVALLEATSRRFPEQHRAAARRPVGVCSPESLAAIEHCARDACSDGDELANCVAERCRKSASLAGPSCVRCLIAHTLANEDLAGCASDGASRQEDRFPRGGVALLSAHPIEQRDTLTLASPLLDRLVLHARLTRTPLGTLDVFCTHLTTPLPFVLPGMSPSVNRHQIESLLAFVASKKPPGAVIVLGDFNSGPPLGGHVRGYYPEHYALLGAAGFSNPYAASSWARCTRCDDNALVPASGPGGILIDHIMVKGHRGSVEAERFLDAPGITPSGPLPLSDHYGVRATFRRWTPLDAARTGSP